MKKSLIHYSFLLICLGFIFRTEIHAQTLVTNVSLLTNTVAATTNAGFNFQGTNISISTLTAGGLVYGASNIANSVYVRRFTSSTNNSDAYYRFTGLAANSNNVISGQNTTYEQLILNNNINSGIDDAFVNANSKTVERLDFYFDGGLVAAANMAFGVFERGPAGAHDPFKIALITGWDTNTAMPTSFATLYAQTANWGPSNIPEIPALRFDILNYTNGNNMSTIVSSSANNPQGVAGMIYSITNLGVGIGTQIYGYSLFGSDVTDAGNPANLIDWNNNTYYPTNTTSAASGVDLISISGILFQETSPIPEPSTYALLFLGLLTLVYSTRKWANKSR